MDTKLLLLALQTQRQFINSAMDLCVQSVCALHIVLDKLFPPVCKSKSKLHMSVPVMTKMYLEWETSGTQTSCPSTIIAGAAPPRAASLPKH